MANPNQRDTDADGYGNLCDADLTGDGFVGLDDLGEFVARFLTDDPDADFDGNGTVDAADLDLVLHSLFGPPGPSPTEPPWPKP